MTPETDLIRLLEEVGFVPDRDVLEIRAELLQFEELLVKWQRIQNLVSRETLNEFWHRHVFDSLQISSLIKRSVRRVMDIGSGGGFPAIPLAIALKGRGIEFHLIEANKRKAAFLKTVSRQLDLGLWVHGCRVEQVDPGDLGQVDLITSRATASLQQLLGLSYPFWSKNTCALFHKGVEYRLELEDSGAKWVFNVISVPSKTDDSGVILDISRLQLKSG